MTTNRTPQDDWVEITADQYLVLPPLTKQQRREKVAITVEGVDIKLQMKATDKLTDWFYDLDPFDQLAHREAFCENNFDQWLKYLQYEFEQQEE